jgi:hypothetical protein
MRPPEALPDANYPAAQQRGQQRYADRQRPEAAERLAGNGAEMA